MALKIEEMLVCRQTRGGCGKNILLVWEPYTTAGQRRRFGTINAGHVSGKIRAIHENEFDAQMQELIQPTKRRVHNYRRSLEEHCSARTNRMTDYGT